MNKNMSKLLIALTMGLGISQVQAQSYYHYDSQPEYKTEFENRRKSIIQDFNVEISNFKVGSVIRFYADGDSNARALVKFNSSGKFWREVPLRETEPGRYTGTYTVRSVDELKDKEFTLSLKKGKKDSTAYYRPVYSTENSYNNSYPYKNPRHESNRYESNHNVPDRNSYYNQSINQNYGTITRVDVRDVQSDEIDYGGTAIGAIVGGLLGNQVGGGSGKKAATVIGAIAGGAAGNQVGKNNGRLQRIWDVSVEFQDGQTAVYNYQNDPEVYVGMPVKKEDGLLIKR